MHRQDLFDAGPAPDLTPQSDAAHRAVASLRGYAYQALSTALAWVDIEEDTRIYLEVAEDYALVCKQAVEVVQVKDTKRSQTVTLNSSDVRNAIASFVDLTARNPDRSIYLRFLTSSSIGKERTLAQRPGGIEGLLYWRRVASATADVEPIRFMLESDRFPEAVRAFSKTRNDDELRSELIERIEWDCGKEDLSSLREELEERIVILGRQQFQLPEAEARKIADSLVFEVLKTAVLDDPNKRVLSQARLYSVIDQATRFSMRRSDLDALMAVSSSLTQSLGDGTRSLGAIGGSALDWLINGESLPVVPGVLARTHIEEALSNALTQCGTAVLTGSSGLGKSIVSRAVCATQGRVFLVADFRDASPKETKLRLNMILARLGDHQFSTLLLEDLNHLEDSQVSLALGRVLQALRRRHRTAIVTCHRKPSANACLSSSLNTSSIVDCPYFSNEEISVLIEIHNGSASTWTRIAHLAGGLGHPQLTHAFVTGMAARSWPNEEIGTVLLQGLTSEDTNAARDAARLYVLSSLSETTRNLLYRLSLVAGRFSRSLALSLGELSPPINQCGDALEELIGPWIEALGNDHFRVSPLAKDFGSKSLGPNQQLRVHETISLQMLGGHSVDAGDIDTIIVHALAGKSLTSLGKVAYIILSSDRQSLERLSDHLMFFRFLRADVSIYPDNKNISAMLRLAQLRLATAKLGDSDVAGIVNTFLNEATQLPDGEARRALEYTGIIVALETIGIANYLDNWFALLLRLRRYVEDDVYLRGLVANFGKQATKPEMAFFSGLFSIGTANIDGVELLERIIDQLNELGDSQREFFLTPIDASMADYSVFINGAWLGQRNQPDFDARDVATRYSRMAEMTRSWSVRALSLQCTVAQAIMLDEYAADKNGALEVLHKTAHLVGPDPILARAVAKVHFNSKEYEHTLRIYREIADLVGAQSPVDRAFALRDAAISAGHCDSWSEAEEWFLEAQNEAQAVSGDDMKAMAVGLGADAAVAALENANVRAALIGLAAALNGLRDLDPESTLRTAYCHRVIRHSVLWVQSRIEKKQVSIDGKPIQMVIGSCSNPEPLPAIRELPLAHIDVAWYMLAQIETGAAIDAKIASRLDKSLEDGSIPLLECQLRRSAIERDLSSLDAGMFARDFTPFVEATAYWRREGKRYVEHFDPIAPERGNIPQMRASPPFGDDIEQISKDSIIAFCICSALEGKFNTVQNLETELGKHFRGLIPGQIVFRQMQSQRDVQGEADSIIREIVAQVGRGDYLTPQEFWQSGLRLFEWINQSSLGSVLVPRLVEWQRSGWSHIIEEQGFYLIRPSATVPPIRTLLTSSSTGRSFLARVLLLTSDAVGSRLASSYRHTLEKIAKEQDTVRV